MKPRTTEDHITKLLAFPGQWLRIRGGPDNRSIEQSMQEVKTALDLMQVPYEINYKQMRVVESKPKKSSGTSTSPIRGKRANLLIFDELLRATSGVDLKSFMAEFINPLPTLNQTQRKIADYVIRKDSQGTSDGPNQEHHSGLRTSGNELSWRGDSLFRP